MHDEPNGSKAVRRSPAREDHEVQQAVLVTVIDLYPVVATVAELVRRLTARPDHFGERDGARNKDGLGGGDQCVGPVTEIMPVQKSDPGKLENGPFDRSTTR